MGEGTGLEALFGRVRTGEPTAQGIGGGGGGGGGGFLGSVSTWLSDPNNQKLLAGIGTAINPTPGSVAAQQAVNAYVGGRAGVAAAREQRVGAADWQAGLSQLAKLLTRPSQPGLTGAEVAEDGTIKAKLTPEPQATAEAQPQAAASQPATPTATQPSPVSSPVSQPITTRSAPTLSQIVPFW